MTPPPPPSGQPDRFIDVFFFNTSLSKILSLEEKMLNGRGGPREVKQFTDFFQLFFESRSAGKYFQAKKKSTLSVKLGFINEKVLCRASLQFITIFGDWG